MSEPAYIPESLRESVPSVPSDDGAVPVGVPASEAYAAKAIVNADGTPVIVPAASQEQYPVPQASLLWPSEGTIAPAIGTQEAAQLGLFRLVKGLSWYGYSFEDLANDGDINVHAEVRQGANDVGSTNWQPWRAGRVFVDFPGQDQKESPRQSVTITEAAESEHRASGLNAREIEGTQDVFMPGTYLRYKGEVLYHFLVVVEFAHKESRRGFQAALENALAAEEIDDRFARRVMIPEFFRRQVTYEQLGSARPDGGTDAQENRWMLEIRVDAEIVKVDLVRTQPTFAGLVTSVNVGQCALCGCGNGLHNPLCDAS